MSSLLLKKKKKVLQNSALLHHSSIQEPSGTLVPMRSHVRKFRGTAKVLPPSTATQY